MRDRFFKDADVRRSLAYLGVSLAVAGIKSVIEFIKNRQNGG